MAFLKASVLLCAVIGSVACSTSDTGLSKGSKVPNSMEIESYIDGKCSRAEAAPCNRGAVRTCEIKEVKSGNTTVRQCVCWCIVT